MEVGRIDPSRRLNALDDDFCLYVCLTCGGAVVLSRPLAMCWTE